MTKRLIVFMILDELKSVNGDSYINEDHVLFLMSTYRSYLLELKRQKEKNLELSESYYLEICLDLSAVDSIPGVPCGGLYLKSDLEIPTMVDKSLAKVYPYDYFNTNITYVSRDRFKYVGFNKYMNNIIYATLGMDNHLYLKSNNPQYTYLEKVRMSGVFEDSEKADELSCNSIKEDGTCIDPLDLDFPIAPELLPLMIELIVKELINALYRPADNINDSTDNLADLISFVRRNMKSDLAKQIAG